MNSISTYDSIFMPFIHKRLVGEGGGGGGGGGVCVCGGGGGGLCVGGEGAGGQNIMAIIK